MTDEQYHIIDQYINNQLEGEALLAFELQLQQDAELAEAVRLFTTLNNEMPAIIKNKPGGEVLKKNLQQISEPHFKNKQAPVVSLKKSKIYQIAAVAAMLIAMAGIVFWQLTKPDKVSLYAQYAGHSEIDLVSRGSIEQEALAKATEYYNNGEYATVIPLLQPILDKDSTNNQYRVILGRCYIETNNYENAFAQLNSVAASTSAYKYEAVWLTALAWLKQNKNAECINALKTIPESDDHYTEAQELLKILNDK